MSVPSLVVYLGGAAANQSWSRGILEALPDLPTPCSTCALWLWPHPTERSSGWTRCCVHWAELLMTHHPMAQRGRAGVTLQSTSLKLGSKPHHPEGLSSAGRCLLTSQRLCALPCGYTPHSRTHCLDFLQLTRPCQGETSTLTPAGLKAADTHLSSGAPGIQTLLLSPLHFRDLIPMVTSSRQPALTLQSLNSEPVTSPMLELKSLGQTRALVCFTRLSCLGQKWV